MKNSSIQAYKEVNHSGKASTHRNIILNALDNWELPKSRFFLENHCELDRHQMSKRMIELVRSGDVQEHEDIYCKIAKRRVTHYTKVRG